MRALWQVLLPSVLLATSEPPDATMQSAGVSWRDDLRSWFRPSVSPVLVKVKFQRRVAQSPRSSPKIDYGGSTLIDDDRFY